LFRPCRAFSFLFNTQGCGCFAALPWALLFRAFRAESNISSIDVAAPKTATYTAPIRNRLNKEWVIDNLCGI
jgi:hypothetical protein